MTPAPISVERLKEVVRFLCGEGELDGYTFGEGPVVGKVTRRYWWRAKLVEAVSVVPALLHQLAEMDAEVAELREVRDGLLRDLATTTDTLAARAEAAERDREEAFGLLREVLVWRRTVPPIAETPRKDGGIFGRIAALLAASGGVVTRELDTSNVVTREVTVRHNDDGSLDEVVGSGQFHLEQMDYNKWWMQLGPHMVTLTARGKISAWFGKNEAATPASGGPRDG